MEPQFDNLETKIRQFGEWYTNVKGWAEALIPGVLIYNHIREIKKSDNNQNRETREILMNGSIKQKAVVYAQYAAGEIILDIARGGLVYAVYLYVSNKIN